MKRITSIFIILSVISSLFSGIQLYADEPTYVVAGIYDKSNDDYVFSKYAPVGLTFKGAALNTDIPPLLVNDRTLVPIRVIAENLGALVSWNADKRQVSIDTDDDNIVLTINDPVALVDDKKMNLPDGVAPILATYKDTVRTLVPLRFIADSMGIDLEWNNDTFSVDIKSSKIVVVKPTPSPSPSPTTKPSTTPSQSPAVTPAETPKTTDNTKPAADKPKRNEKFTLVLDAGHGGTDPGAIHGEFHEADINLDMALMVRDELAKDDINIIMTRTTDVFVTLLDRSRIANNANADFFCSIHTNSATVDYANGIEVYYQAPGGYAIKAAKIMQREMVKATGAVDRGAQQNNLSVTRNTKMPAILLEMGFISNDNDRELLYDKEYRQKLLKGITNGLREIVKMIKESYEETE